MSHSISSLILSLVNITFALWLYYKLASGEAKICSSITFIKQKRTNSETRPMQPDPVQEKWVASGIWRASPRLYTCSIEAFIVTWDPFTLANTKGGRTEMAFWSCWRSAKDEAFPWSKSTPEWQITPTHKYTWKNSGHETFCEGASC